MSVGKTHVCVSICHGARKMCPCKQYIKTRDSGRDEIMGIHFQCHANLGVCGNVRWEGKGEKTRTSSRNAEEAVAAAFFLKIPPMRYGVERHRDFSSDF